MNRSTLPTAKMPNQPETKNKTTCGQCHKEATDSVLVHIGNGCVCFKNTVKTKLRMEILSIRMEILSIIYPINQTYVFVTLYTLLDVSSSPSDLIHTVKGKLHTISRPFTFLLPPCQVPMNLTLLHKLPEYRDI